MHRVSNSKFKCHNSNNEKHIFVAIDCTGGTLAHQGHVYGQIGSDGVYYGFKLGREVPWCTAFPFTTFRHPQYVSATSLFLGLLLACGWRGGDSLVLFAGQVWLYTFTGFMEEMGDQDAPEKGDPKSKKAK